MSLQCKCLVDCILTNWYDGKHRPKSRNGLIKLVDRKVFASNILDIRYAQI